MPVFCQMVNNPVQMSYALDSVEVTRAETFSNRLNFYNTSDITAVVKKIRTTEGALIELPDTLTLAPGARRSFFSQYMADPNYLRKIGSTIQTVYEYNHQQLVDSFYLRMPEDHQLSISSFTKDVYLDSKSGQTKLQMTIRNNGYTSVTFTLEGKSFPEGVKIYSKSNSYLLLAGEQQVISLEIKNFLNNNFSNDFKFYLTAIDHKGKQLAQSTFNLLNLSSEKRFSIGNNMYSTPMDFVRFGYLNSNSGVDNLDISARLNQRYNAGGIGDYQLNYRYYIHPIQGSEVFDSYVSYEGDRFKVRLGTVMENMDFSAYGQGGEVKINIAKDQKLTSFYLQKNYLLYSNLFSGLKGADVWGVKYDYHEGKDNALQMAFLSSSDPITGVKTQLIHGTKEVKLSKTSGINLETGLSHETLINRSRDSGNAGFAIGLDYHAQFRKLSVNSNNYYSSPYYGGLHRGTIQLYERVSQDLGKSWNTYLQLDHQENQPEYLNSYYNYWTQNNSQTVFGYGVGKRWSNYYFSLRPYYFNQHLEQTVNGNQQNASSNGWHLEAIGSLYYGSHQLNIRGDYGLVQSDNPYYFKEQLVPVDKMKSYQDWRLSLSYNYKMAGIDFNLQHNPYYIFEEPNALQSGKYRQYSISPHGHLTLFNKKLQLKASGYFNYNGHWNYWTNNYQLEANWFIATLWQLQVLSNILTFQKQTGSYQQTRVSVVRNLLKKNNQGFHQWNVRFYGDLNANGHWDKDETAIQGVIVSINGAPAISDRHGRVIFSNLDPKWYKLVIGSGMDWTILDTIGQLVNKNVRQDIPLIKSVKVSGVITGKENPYTVQLPVLEGIRVYAINDNGKQYSTLSDSQGKFNFYLPYGTYDILIEQMNGNYDIIIGRTKLKISSENIHQLPGIHFEIVDAKKKVKIQQF